ncbi:helix-turn-helix transcriptional regulator [Parasphingorhabdus sp.]|uniref:helix-turn-helix transcriptional regulator n=1 Tax=Parasphingorhabdus sp. TaxID=2709688 RepID=UPI003A8D4976
MKTQLIQHRLVDFISKIEAAESFEEGWECLTQTMNDLGFNVVNYTVFPDTKTFTQPQFIENFKNDWIAHYARQEYELEDALIPHVLNSDVPAIMLAVDEEQPLVWSEKGRRLVAEAREAGMERAIGFSHKNGDGVIDGGIALGTDQMSAAEFRTVVKRDLPLLYMIYSIAYHKLHFERRRNISLDIYRISPRQHEVLLALWDGLANKQIAARLQVSEVTVSFHLRELRNKLGCHLNREILPRAYHLGLLGRLV